MKNLIIALLCVFAFAALQPKEAEAVFPLFPRVRANIEFRQDLQQDLRFDAALRAAQLRAIRAEQLSRLRFNSFDFRDNLRFRSSLNLHPHERRFNLEIRDFSFVGRDRFGRPVFRDNLTGRLRFGN